MLVIVVVIELIRLLFKMATAVWWLLVFFLLFGVVAAWYATARPDFAKVEMAYIVLSFVAKATLVLLLTGGLLSST